MTKARSRYGFLTYKTIKITYYYAHVCLRVYVYAYVFVCKNELGAEVKVRVKGYLRRLTVKVRVKGSGYLGRWRARVKG